jgi:hypothetical protein
VARCWCTTVIPALGRLRQEDPKFKAHLGYLGRPCLEKKDKGDVGKASIVPTKL